MYHDSVLIFSTTFLDHQLMESMKIRTIYDTLNWLFIYVWQIRDDDDNGRVQRVQYGLTLDVRLWRLKTSEFDVSKRHLLKSKVDPRTE